MVVKSLGRGTYHKLFPLDLQLFDKESRTTQLVFSYQGGKKVSKKTKSDKSLCTMMYFIIIINLFL